MILENDVLVKVNKKTLEYYRKFGYEGKSGDNLLVKVEDLPKSSNVKLTKICDCCGNTVGVISYYSISNARIKGDGKDRCKSCAMKLVRKNVPFNKSLEYFAKNNNKEYLLEEFSDKNNITPDKIYRASNNIYIWICGVCNTPYEQNVTNRTCHDVNCPYCAGRQVNHTNSLATLNSHLASEWHPTLNGDLTPHDVTCNSNKEVWWKCSKHPNHEWKTTVGSRNSRSKGCPYCSGRYATDIDNLEVKFTELSNEWDYDKNNRLPCEYKAFSDEIVWWKCKKGHEWSDPIIYRTNAKDKSCPYCSHKIASEEYSLVTEYPEIAKEWNYKKNEGKPSEYLPYSNKIVWWTCKNCDNEWNTAIENRSTGNGCPVCAESKGEQRIRKWLEDYQITFTAQKDYPDLFGIGGGLLSYDFYLPNQNLLIEYQGEFHDGSGAEYTKTNLPTQQEHDRRKKEYARQNDIKLLEIWYWYFENIETILEKELKGGNVIV